MSFLFGRSRTSDVQIAAERLHDSLVAAVRTPAFYLHLGVPDTFEGRFDLLVLHVALMLRRLHAAGSTQADLAQHLVDTLFQRLDVAMRELGVSDIGVPKRMKRLAEAFGGRTAAYGRALDTGDANELAAAISRNILDGTADAQGLAHYAIAVERVLNAIEPAALRVGLPPLPEPSLEPHKTMP